MRTTQIRHRSALLVAIFVGAALALSSLVVAAPANAVADSTSFSELSFVKPLASTVSLPSSGVKDATFSLKFTGTAVDSSDSNGDSVYISYSPYTSTYTSASISRVASIVPAADVFAPRVHSYPTSSTVAPNTNLTYTIRVSYYTTPGVYRVSVPITQKASDYSTSPTTTTTTTKWANATFTVTSNTKYSKSETYGGMTGKLRGKFTGTIYGPDYQKGAKFTVYYKAAGKKKFKKVATGKLSTYTGYSSKGSFTVKKGKITKKGKWYVKVGGVKYAAGYSSATGKVS